MDPLELLPGIGKIGAAVGVRGGWAQSPYELGKGAQGSGFIHLPLKAFGTSVLSYEIAIGYVESKSEPFVATNAVAFIANLATTGRGDSGPYPVRRLVRSEGRIVTIEPVSFHFAKHAGRTRPYVAVGGGFAIVLTKEVPQAASTTPGLDGALIGGQIAQSIELSNLGRPSGQGNVELMAHAGAGVEFRVSHSLSLQADYRYSRLRGRLGSMHTASAGLGIHF